ncbi:hypothetical protein C1645_876067 [Glomus cerebriforme]|uniref:Uncharacterized protein n=1 Tax=Glomus cerebriforme TaxID=658196 RepID=A0A397SXU9_9GLOM|nr:hypothetical protein C1645_876067 [Glomus cerebriforme]
MRQKKYKKYFTVTHIVLTFLNDLNSKNVDNTSKSSKDDSKILSKVFENMQINSNNNIQNEYEKETIQQIKKNNIDDVVGIDIILSI